MPEWIVFLLWAAFGAFVACLLVGLLVLLVLGLRLLWEVIGA